MKMRRTRTKNADAKLFTSIEMEDTSEFSLGSLSIRNFMRDKTSRRREDGRYRYYHTAPAMPSRHQHAQMDAAVSLRSRFIISGDARKHRRSQKGRLEAVISCRKMPVSYTAAALRRSPIYTVPRADAKQAATAGPFADERQAYELYYDFPCHFTSKRQYGDEASLSPSECPADDRQVAHEFRAEKFQP